MHARRTRAICALLLLAAACSDAPEPTATERPGVIERAPAPDPGPPPRQLTLVLQLAGAGRIDEAFALAGRYVREHPADGRGHVMLGMAHRAAGNYEPAVEELERALELAPDYWPARRYLGECRFLLGELDAARREYAALAAADPAEPAAAHGLGLVELEAGELGAAEARFREAIALFEELGRRDPRRSHARRSELAECHGRLADVHFARGEYAAARDELLAATALEPGNISAFYMLSQVHRRLGEEAAAERALERYESAKAAIERRAEARR